MNPVAKAEVLQILHLPQKNPRVASLLFSSQTKKVSNWISQAGWDALWLRQIRGNIFKAEKNEETGKPAGVGFHGYQIMEKEE